MSAPPTEPSLDQHFADRKPVVREIYTRIVGAAKRFGNVREEPKKTSIHLANRTAFAGVATRRDALVLTIKASADIESPRIVKREQVSRNRWHVELRLDDPRQVDGELKRWLRQAFELAGE